MSGLARNWNNSPTHNPSVVVREAEPRLQRSGPTPLKTLSRLLISHRPLGRRLTTGGQAEPPAPPKHMALSCGRGPVSDVWASMSRTLE
jgi:hypothetical protein